MNWQRGLLRLWIAVSVIWIGGWVVVDVVGGFPGSPELLVSQAVLVLIPVVGVLLLGFIAAWVIAGFRR